VPFSRAWGGGARSMDLDRRLACITRRDKIHGLDATIFVRAFIRVLHPTGEAWWRAHAPMRVLQGQKRGGLLIGIPAIISGALFRDAELDIVLEFHVRDRVVHEHVTRCHVTAHVLALRDQRATECV